MNNVAILLLLLCTTCPVFGQGVGTPTSLGTIPRIDAAHDAVGVSNTLSMTDFAPGSPLFIFAALRADPLPLQPFGLGPAVLGPDVDGPDSSFFAGVTADPRGELVLPFFAPPSLAHRPLHIQVIASDAAAPFGGAAVSRHAVLTFGLERHHLPMAFDLGGGVHVLAELFAYGALAAPVDPRLTDVRFVDLALPNDDEMAFGALSRPVADALDDLARRVRMPDGSVLIGVRSTTFEDGIVRATPDGSLEVVAWAQGAATDPAFEPLVAVSAHDPYLALVGEQPLPEYGGASLVIARTDGGNVPGSHRSAMGIPAPAGLAVDSESLCFLDGALFFGDGATQLLRCDLATLSVTPVVFPPSGGATPSYVDESCAPASGGAALAIGAGVNKDLHDVYVVTAAGNATNVTGLPGDYEDAGPADPTGMQLAMDGAGGQVAYMRTVIETETFVRDLGSPAEAHVTNAGQYINSIDSVVGLGFSVTAGSVVLSAGRDLNASDLYRATAPPAGGAVTQVTNLSATSGMTAPPFGLGATLELTRRFTSGASIFYEHDNSSGPRRLQVVDEAGATAAFDLGTLLATAPIRDALVVIDRIATGTIRCRTIATTPGNALLASLTTSGPRTLAARAIDVGAGTAAWLVADAVGSTELIRVDAAGALTVHPGPPGLTNGSLALEPGGGVVAMTFDQATGSSAIHRLGTSGTWTSATGPVSGPATGRFLR